MRFDRGSLPLSTEQVDVWQVFTDDVRDPSLVLHYESLLTPEEREQHMRFLFPRDRTRYLITRALVRDILSRYAPIAPGDWRFAPSDYGRPLIQNDLELARRISFNISHADGLIVLAVVRDRALGVDTENLLRRAPLDIADGYFSALECVGLRNLQADARPRRFFELWTLKESYIKARGMGLSLPLDKFSFRLDRERHVEIEFAADADDSPERWMFWQWQASPGHLCALCLEAAGGAPATLVLRRAVPFASEHLVECQLLRSPGRE